ncbi:MAG TPA: TAXI family TRAP transporter solute-binding subunit [Candidatus Binataceae bacterium]|nr:TAXI family TRAP transporter solute-binding subunit [Candidatus Binataceae bacterium]
MAEKIRLSSIEGGGNWWLALNWAGQAFRNAGFEVEMARHGKDASDTVRRVVRGDADISMTLAIAAAQAAKGLGLYKNGDGLAVRGLGLMLRPGHHFFNMVRADLGIRSFADIAQKKPKLDIQVGEADYVAGQITEVYLRHYGVELYRDIVAWGGSLQTSFPDSVPLLVQGRSNAIMRENTARGPAAFAAQMADWAMLTLDRDIAERIEREYCAPAVTLPPGTLRGQKEPCLTVTDPGYVMIINQDLPNDLVYRLAKALNESSAHHWAAEDIFYSIRHAPETHAPLHPGAARYYREQGVLK